MKTSLLLALLVVAPPFVANSADKFTEALGTQFSAKPYFGAGIPLGSPNSGLSPVRRWNQIANDASGLDHTPVRPGENRVFGEQIGPCRSSRAMAIAHIAMLDTINAVLGEHESYTGVRARPSAMSLEAAISQAAHDTLVLLFPSQAARFNAYLEQDLAGIKNKRAKANGIALGQQVAATLMQMRLLDGSEVPEPRVGIGHLTSNLAGHWRQDPISLIPLALGAKWPSCKPFVLQSGAQFRLPAPPAMDSAEYAIAYNEVKLLGGDGIITPTERTAEQTEIGIYWAYDGTPSLCAPPRLYNQIAILIADQMGTSEIELARLLTLVNVAMAEAGLTSWDSKYFHDFWRPVTGIRESDLGTGPTGSGDGNDATTGDPTFSPLGAPASNLQGPNFTPPFPAYPSGHATFGGALFGVLRRFYGTDNIPFTFVSDELNGVTRDNQGHVRPLIPRSFTTLSQAEEENGQSRIYLGIHWSFDKTGGILQGNQVADYVFENSFKPRHRGRR
jgi:hypothetical protein